MKVEPGWFFICFIPDKIKCLWIKARIAKRLVAFIGKPLVVRLLWLIFRKKKFLYGTAILQNPENVSFPADSR